MYHEYFCWNKSILNWPSWECMYKTLETIKFGSDCASMWILDNLPKSFTRILNTFNPFSARISMIFVLFVMDLTPCYLKLQYKVTHFWKDYELSFSKMFLLFIYNISACSSNYIFCRSFYEKRRKIWISRLFSNFSAYIEIFIRDQRIV